MNEFPELEQKLNNHLAHLERELSTIRSGRATPALIEEIKVDYYDSLQPIKTLGSIRVLDARNLIVEPWDKKSLEAIADAINKSQSGLNASVDRERVRVPLPPLSQERRREFIRLSGKHAEETKIRIRQLRDEEMKTLNEREKSKEISEDEKFRQKEKIEKIFKEYTEKIENIKEKKEKELLAV